MELIWIILGALCIIIGLIGAFLPILPGLPFSYLGLLILQFSGVATFSTTFLVVWAIVIVAILVLENALPAYTTKKFGGTTYGSTGSLIGMVMGMFFFPPLGFFLGTLVGAFVGEMLYKQDVNVALKSAWGSFLGFLTGTMIKTIVAAMFAVMFFQAVF
jgi:uncharacterized protein YqgC (DUF456 family)